MKAFAVFALAVAVQGAFVKLSSGQCGSGPKIMSLSECESAINSLGINRPVVSQFNTYMPSGCIERSGTFYYFNTRIHSMQFSSMYKGICYEEETEKVCIDVRKKKACKALPQCNYDKDSSPMCTDKTPGQTIPIKDYCEIIPTRGWCKLVPECLWTGDKCLLKADAECTDIVKRRICNPYRAKNFGGGCLGGKNCFWMGKCVAAHGAGQNC